MGCLRECKKPSFCSTQLTVLSGGGSNSRQLLFHGGLNFSGYSSFRWSQFLGFRCAESVGLSSRESVEVPRSEMGSFLMCLQLVELLLELLKLLPGFAEFTFRCQSLIVG